MSVNTHFTISPMFVFCLNIKSSVTALILFSIFNVITFSLFTSSLMTLTSKKCYRKMFWLSEAVLISLGVFVCTTINILTWYPPWKVSADFWVSVLALFMSAVVFFTTCFILAVLFSLTEPFLVFEQSRSYNFGTKSLGLYVFIIIHLF